MILQMIMVTVLTAGVLRISVSIHTDLCATNSTTPDFHPSSLFRAIETITKRRFENRRALIPDSSKSLSSWKEKVVLSWGINSKFSSRKDTVGFQFEVFLSSLFKNSRLINFISGAFYKGYWAANNHSPEWFGKK